jgi:hypothetical protein
MAFETGSREYTHSGRAPPWCSDPHPYPFIGSATSPAEMGVGLLRPAVGSSVLPV